MKLTMKTYKGYNKQPYCNTHYPTTKFTAVADTPENRRLAKQTANQSNIVYHKDHQENLTKFSQVVDSPAMETSIKNQKIASQVNYTQKTQAAPQPNPAASHQYGEPEDYNPERELESVQPAVSREPPPPQIPQAPPAASGPRYKALYDYTAADDDEVSFMEGDTISDVNVIDDGWMEGTVDRTGQHGMLPSNYVEAF
jgi:hypothetical protein